MINFRQFEAGPDPFGRKFQVFFKWLQTAISIRHADTVDVKFVLVDDNEIRSEKTIALQHADLLTVARETKRQLDDAWCARLAAMHLLHLIETGEDMEKDLVTVSLADLRQYAATENRMEREAVKA
jgi:class 3 adenylate cyclase